MLPSPWTAILRFREKRPSAFRLQALPMRTQIEPIARICSQSAVQARLLSYDANPTIPMTMGRCCPSAGWHTAWLRACRRPTPRVPFRSGRQGLGAHHQDPRRANRPRQTLRAEREELRWRDSDRKGRFRLAPRVAFHEYGPRSQPTDAGGKESGKGCPERSAGFVSERMRPDHGTRRLWRIGPSMADHALSDQPHVSHPRARW